MCTTIEARQLSLVMEALPFRLTPSGPATARSEWTGTWSTYNLCEECDTNQKNCAGS